MLFKTDHLGGIKKVVHGHQYRQRENDTVGGGTPVISKSWKVTLKVEMRKGGESGIKYGIASLNPSFGNSGVPVNGSCLDSLVKLEDAI